MGTPKNGVASQGSLFRPEPFKKDSFKGDAEDGPG